ncbi:MAG: hypothetical protein H5T63_03810 [Chloroflexi bacterium]|nr:hypothetical protein [Chloroflexota bacterium]
MLEEEKEKGKAIAKLPPAERNKLIARMMFGEGAPQAQMAMFMLMGAWGIAPPGPPGGPHGPEGPPPQH